MLIAIIFAIKKSVRFLITSNYFGLDS